MTSDKEIRYRGRFAPSPTGLLHLGSLSSALGSFLDTKSNQGEWLLRIEDIDPPREAPDAKDIIPQQLADHGLDWDGSISYQSENSDRYIEALQALEAKKATYPCSCSRQDIKRMGGLYDRTCLRHTPKADTEVATRLLIDDAVGWTDLIRGKLEFSCTELGGDFVLRRKEGLFSYQLAVAVDDHQQGITRVVRGADLLDSTARQLHIFKHLGLAAPEYAHLPVMLAANGQKLSKQNFAPALDSSRATENIYQALRVLGQNPPEKLKRASLSTILQWGIHHWSLRNVPAQDKTI